MGCCRRPPIAIPGGHRGTFAVCRVGTPGAVSVRHMPVAASQEVNQASLGPCQPHPHRLGPWGLLRPSYGLWGGTVREATRTRVSRLSGNQSGPFLWCCCRPPHPPLRAHHRASLGRPGTPLEWLDIHRNGEGHGLGLSNDLKESAHAPTAINGGSPGEMGGY
jgi:hypothetical protein